jgi:hypothetical protein
MSAVELPQAVSAVELPQAVSTVEPLDAAFLRRGRRR